MTKKTGRGLQENSLNSLGKAEGRVRKIFFVVKGWCLWAIPVGNFVDGDVIRPSGFPLGLSMG